MTRLVELVASRLRREPQGASDAGFIDPISGLPSRPWLIAELKKALSRSKHKASVAVAIVEFADIGGVDLKEDKSLIKRLASLLRAWVPADCGVGYLQEREFAVIFCAVPLVDIQKLADDIVQKTRREPSLDAWQRRIIPIIGLGCSSRGEGDASHLLTLADIALHYARSTGRGWHAVVDSAFVPSSDRARRSSRGP